MVTANNEVAHPEIFSNERMPHRLTRTGHSHGQWQYSQFDARGRIMREQTPVAADTRMGVDIALFSAAHDRMQEESPVHGIHRPASQFDVRSVHGITGLERNDIAPALAFKPVAQ
jgi:hypothetical protein